MKRSLGSITKKIITIWIITASVILSSVLAYAIYTRVTIVKRVVSTQEGASSLFSSNHMNTGGMKSVEPFVDNTQDASVPIYVYNYIYPKEAVYRTDDTEYDFVVTLGTMNSSDIFTALSSADSLAGLNYSVTYEGTSEEFVFGESGEVSHTFYGCSITGGNANFDMFTAVFDESELGSTPPGYCLKIEANPYSTDLPKLTGYIMVRFSKQATTGWSGELEVLDDDKDYDGYNYYLEGNGKGKLTFRWNPTYVRINKDFLKNKNNKFYYVSGDTFVKYSTAPEESSLPSSNGMVSITIEVDSSKQNRYEVQFFKTNATATENYTNLLVKGYLPDTLTTDWHPDTSE